MKNEVFEITMPEAYVPDPRSKDEIWVDSISQAEVDYHYTQISNKISDLSSNRRKLIVERFDSSKK